MIENPFRFVHSAEAEELRGAILECQRFTKIEKSIMLVHLASYSLELRHMLDTVSLLGNQLLE